MKSDSNTDLRPVRAAPVPEPVRSRPDEDTTFADYLALVAASRWLIATVVLVSMALGAAYVTLAAPSYWSDILVQVEEKQQGLGLEGLEDIFARNSPAETEMEIIRSRSLLGAVVDELTLDVDADPRTFPIFGGAMLRRYSGAGLREPVLGLRRFAWGGERIALGRLEVPEALLGHPLTLVAGAQGDFTVLDDDGQNLLGGRVGEPAAGGGVALFVRELRARPGTEFVISRLRRGRAISALQRNLRISEKGKKTGVLSVALESEEPRRAAAILDAVAGAYLRQNVARKTAEAQKTLEFLESQLPQLKANLETAEAKLESYRARKGSVDVSLQTQATLTRAVELEKGLSELAVQRAELSQRFTASHPLLAAVDKKQVQLQAERAAVEERLKQLPQAELESARLIRDANLAKELYVLLLNKSQEVRVVKSGAVGNVRILDSAAVPFDPVSPQQAQTLLVSALLGIVAGISIAFAKRALNRGVEDPEEIERDTGVPLFASIPRSAAAARLDRGKGNSGVLATNAPEDSATESLRSLRTSLQFALVDAPNRIITLLGPAPSVGKTFCSVNLSAVLAESGKRVVLVDADLRNGRAHRFFGRDRESGLSDLIGGTASLDSVVRATHVPGLHLITTGRIPPNPASLLGGERFAEILKELERRFDHVVVDTSPVLAVTDPTLVARHAGVNLLVLRAGRHPMREISATVRRLEQSGASVHGIVLNGVEVGLGYGRYHYAYQSANPSARW